MKILKGKFKSILVIGDQHFPYQHQDALSFLKLCKGAYKPDLIINIGDETDGHAWSYHEPDPELLSPGWEFRKARTGLKKLQKIFPKMELIESNHGSLYWRKQKSMGLPKDFFKDYQEAWDVGPGWNWHYDLTVEMSNGNLCYFHHGKTSQVLKLSQSLGMSAVQGHYHEKMGVKYWQSAAGVFWAAQTGCLVDNESMAMAYNKNNLKSPLLGSLVIINGWPISVPMILNKNKRWIGRLV